MADDDVKDSDTPGGTPEGKEDSDESKTFSEEEVATLVKTAAKEGETSAFKHWQSVSDKQVAAERSKSEVERKTHLDEIHELKTKRMDGMTPEERQVYMTEELYKERFSTTTQVADKSNEPQDTSPNDDADLDTGAARDAARESVNAVLKDMDIDLTKVDWADDAADSAAATKRFLSSIVKQVNEKAKGEAESDLEQEDANRVDGTRGTPGTFDIMKANPVDLIREGSKGPPIRG